MSIFHRIAPNAKAPTVRILPSGLEIHTKFTSTRPCADSRRGKIRTFSQKSKARLRKKLMAIPFAGLCGDGKRTKQARLFFVTLTYPGDWTDDYALWKRHLDTFSKALHRLSAFGWAIWRIERQKRGAPHFHLLVAFDTPTDRVRLFKWVLAVWHRSTVSADKVHRFKGADVRTVYNKDTRKLILYILKYMSKPDNNDGLGRVGRVWGVWGVMAGGGDIAMQFLIPCQWVDFVRRVRRYCRHSPYLSTRTVSRGFDIIGDSDKLRQLLRGYVMLDVQLEG